MKVTTSQEYGGYRMEHEIKQWIDFFQGLIFTHFRQNKAEAVEVLT